PYGKLQHRRQHDHALGFLQQVRGNIVRDPENFAHHPAGPGHSLVFLFLGANRHHAEREKYRYSRPPLDHKFSKTQEYPGTIASTALQYRSITLVIMGAR